jgi:cobalamin 5'-phosphate synthase/cobalamin synthase
MWFSLVGAGIGAAMGGTADAVGGALGAALALVVGALLTGALHLDGLADTADAFGATTRERALEIMRDHSIGVYGAVALVLDLGAKGAALARLSVHDHALGYAVGAAALARVAPLLLSKTLPYARASEGIGRALDMTGWLRIAVAAAIAAGFCVWLASVWLLLVFAGVLVAAYLAARRFGGVTGDILGAVVEISETVLLVVAVAIA